VWSGRPTGRQQDNERVSAYVETPAYQATGDLVAVADQMGHASVVTTSVYAADDVAAKITTAVVR